MSLYISKLRCLLYIYDQDMWVERKLDEALVGKKKEKENETFI